MHQSPLWALAAVLLLPGLLPSQTAGKEAFRASVRLTRQDVPVGPNNPTCTRAFFFETEIHSWTGQVSPAGLELRYIDGTTNQLVTAQPAIFTVGSRSVGLVTLNATDFVQGLQVQLSPGYPLTGSGKLSSPKLFEICPSPEGTDVIAMVGRWVVDSTAPNGFAIDLQVVQTKAKATPVGSGPTMVTFFQGPSNSFAIAAGSLSLLPAPLLFFECPLMLDTPFIGSQSLFLSSTNAFTVNTPQIPGITYYVQGVFLTPNGIPGSFQMVATNFVEVK